MRFAFRAHRKAPFSVMTGIEMGFTTGNGEMNFRARGMGSLRHTLLISEQSRTIAEQHLIRAAELQHSVSMGTGYYVPALSKQEVYVFELCLQWPNQLCWPGCHL